MQKYNHIKALFFLGIFSMLILHQVVPHLHHQHEVEHTHKVVTHSDDHSHDHGHHHDVPETDNSEKGFLDFFLDLHSHSVVSNEILVLHESTVTQIKLNKEASQAAIFNHYGEFKNYDEVERPTIYHPPNSYFNPYLITLDLRGPPTLG